MRMSPFLLCLILAPLSSSAICSPTGEERPVPEFAHLVAKGESVLASAAADLNGDGLQDVIFIVEPEKQDEGDRDGAGSERTLKIATASSDGSLKVVKVNSKAVLCGTCGGIWGDPFNELEASANAFSVHHFGGGSHRWTSAYTFKFSKRDNTWQLVRVEEATFPTHDPEKITRKIYRPPRSFGKIDIAQFDPNAFINVYPK